jgi:ribose 5-phosphate isomerase A
MSSLSSLPPLASKTEELKRLVGYKAVDDHVTSSTTVGLGTGSTAYYAVERLGQLLSSGTLTDIKAVPTSIRTKEQAESLGIPLTTLDECSSLAVSIDGADSVDPSFNLIKGGGGALFREKLVEVASTKFVVIVDESKLVPNLGSHFPLPVEILPFCHTHTIRVIQDLPSVKQYNGKCVLRLGSSSNNKIDGDDIAVSDNGCYLVDIHFTEPITDPKALGRELIETVGVVEHGLFCNMADEVIVAGEDGVRVLDKA